MSETVSISITVEKQVGSIKRMNYQLTKSVEVDAAHMVETLLEAGAVDQEIVLYDSTLITETEFILLQTDQPLTIKLGDVGNTAIEVEDVMLLTDSNTSIFVSVPGTENATVEIIYAGKTA